MFFFGIASCTITISNSVFGSDEVYIDQQKNIKIIGITIEKQPLKDESDINFNNNITSYTTWISDAAVDMLPTRHTVRNIGRFAAILIPAAAAIYCDPRRIINPTTYQKLGFLGAWASIPLLGVGWEYTMDKIEEYLPDANNFTINNVNFKVKELLVEHFCCSTHGKHTHAIAVT